MKPGTMKAFWDREIHEKHETSMMNQIITEPKAQSFVYFAVKKEQSTKPQHKFMNTKHQVQ